jgi:thiol-disulfide isomerase/thioredoxin
MSHRMFVAAVLAALVWASAAGQARLLARSDEPASGAKLVVGDAPPQLKATKWLQGEPVAQFEPGRVYVVEFWATWCGPCIAVMPHVGDLQKQYRDKGVTVIGFTASDPSNTAERVAKFVSKRGPKLGYTFAFADNRDTYDAYMKAAKQNGIPCSYVVGKDGKIAFIGHPAFLDYVLPRVLAGTWDAKEGAAEVARADAEFDKVYAAVLGPDVEKGMKSMSELEEKRPALADSPYFTVPRISMLLRAKKFDAARTAIQKAISKANDQDDSYLLFQLANTLKTPAARDEKSLAALSVQAAETLLRIEGDKDVRALLAAAEAHKAAGEADLARALADKAIAAAEAAVAAEAGKPTSATLYLAAEANFAAGNSARAKEWGHKAIEASEGPQQKEGMRRAVEKFNDQKKKEDTKPREIKPPSRS